MTRFNRKGLGAAGALALALALPFAMAGCSTAADTTADADKPAAEAAAGEADQKTDASSEQPTDDEARQKAQQVAQITYYDGESEPVATTYTYDEAGRLTSAEDATMSQKWIYDEAGRLTNAETTYAPDDESTGGTQITTYVYDEAGTLVERTLEDTTEESLDPETGEPMTDPDTGVVIDDYKHSYTYEDDGKKMTTAVTNAEGQWTSGTVSTFDKSVLDVFPTVSTEVEELGTVIDPWKPVKEETVDENGAVLETSEYTYNEAGDITSLSTSYEGDEGTEKFSWTFAYDDKGNETSTTFTVDGEEEEDLNPPTEWTYNEAGQPIQKVSTDPFFGTIYEFYTYDSAGRLKSITFVQPQSGAEAFVGCQIIDYAADNEDSAQTAEQLIEEAKAKVPADAASDTGEELDLGELEGDELMLDGLEEGEEIDPSDLEGLEGIEIDGTEEDAA